MESVFCHKRLTIGSALDPSKTGQICDGPAAAKAGEPTSTVLKLSDGQSIPKSLLEKYSTPVIGQSIVARFHQRYEAEDNESKPDFDFWKNTEIEMAFSDVYISAIQSQFR
jgi:hypothetical protein